MLIIGGSEPAKVDVLLNVIKRERPDIDEPYLYAKYPLEPTCHLLINGRKKAGIKKLKNH